MTRNARIIFSLLLLVACSPVSRKSLTKTFIETEKILQDHTGFMLYDPSIDKELFSYNAAQYFTPASNTKIFTFYTSLVLLGDSIPALRYIERGDSLIFSGTGDPSLLYPHTFTNTQTFDFLRNSDRELYFTDYNFFTTFLGRGWAWSDYNYAYSSERSALPIYGNVFSVKQKPNSGLLGVSPPYFKKHFWLADSIARYSDVIRELGSNRTDFFPGKTWKENTWEVPFKTEPLVITELLMDTLKRTVSHIHYNIDTPFKILYSVPSDSLYKVMMQESDNFIAEQLLLMCAGILSDSLKPEIAINHITKNYLYDLPDKPVWVDGSGLSRYNLFTPRSIVALWKKISQQVNQERLFSLLAIGGKTGTIKNLYKAEPPFIYGKTGTLSNNHCLSGFLVTKKGKTLIFSFMSNNYVVPAAEVRAHMDKILRTIYENY